MPKDAPQARSYAVGDWRSALREYAQVLCGEARVARAANRPPQDAEAAFPDAARAALGDQAEIVRTIVVQLAVGAAASGSDLHDVERALDEQLSLLLEGIAPRLRRSVPANNAESQ